jgi:hypothetical protein
VRSTFGMLGGGEFDAPDEPPSSQDACVDGHASEVLLADVSQGWQPITLFLHPMQVVKISKFLGLVISFLLRMKRWRSRVPLSAVSLAGSSCKLRSLSLILYL